MDVYTFTAVAGSAARAISPSEVFSRRVEDVTAERASQGLSDPTPSPADIERAVSTFDDPAPSHPEHYVSALT